MWGLVSEPDDSSLQLTDDSTPGRVLANAHQGQTNIEKLKGVPSD